MEQTEMNALKIIKIKFSPQTYFKEKMNFYFLGLKQDLMIKFQNFNRFGS